MLASAPLLPKFVGVGAAMYHELRKRGTRTIRLPVPLLLPKFVRAWAAMYHELRKRGTAPSQLQALLVGEPAQQRRHVGCDALARRRKRRREIVHDRGKRRLAGAALEDLDRDGVRLEYPFGRQQHPAALRLVVHQAHAARQPRLGVGRDGGLGSIGHGRSSLQGSVVSNQKSARLDRVTLNAWLH